LVDVDLFGQIIEFLSDNIDFWFGSEEPTQESGETILVRVKFSILVQKLAIPSLEKSSVNIRLLFLNLHRFKRIEAVQEFSSRREDLELISFDLFCHIVDSELWVLNATIDESDDVALEHGVLLEKTMA